MFDRRLGGGAQRPNREIVLFRSCVRASGDCQVEMSPKRHPWVFPVPFSVREAFPFPLGSSPFSQAAIQLKLALSVSLCSFQIVVIDSESGIVACITLANLRLIGRLQQSSSCVR